MCIGNPLQQMAESLYTTVFIPLEQPFIFSFYQTPLQLERAAFYFSTLSNSITVRKSSLFSFHKIKLHYSQKERAVFSLSIKLNSITVRKSSLLSFHFIKLHYSQKEQPFTKFYLSMLLNRKSSLLSFHDVIKQKEQLFLFACYQPV